MFLQFVTVKERASTILTNFQYEEFFFVHCAMPQRRNAFVYNCMYCTHQLMLITMFKYCIIVKEVANFCRISAAINDWLWDTNLSCRVIDMLAASKSNPAMLANPRVNQNNS